VLVPRLDEVRADITDARVRYRELAAHAGLHRRTPGIVADLFIAACPSPTNLSATFSGI
jgi:hypothetical protein